MKSKSRCYGLLVRRLLLPDRKKAEGAGDFVALLLQEGRCKLSPHLFIILKNYPFLPLLYFSRKLPEAEGWETFFLKLAGFPKGVRGGREKMQECV